MSKKTYYSNKRIKGDLIMSEVVNKKDKTATFGRFLISVSLDNKIQECLAVEGVDGTDDAVDRFLNWYLVYRSEFFPTLKRDDIDSVKDTIRELELGEKSLLTNKYELDIPTKDSEGNVTGNQILSITFSPFKFGMLLSF
jgi:hypothetical protein